MRRKVARKKKAGDPVVMTAEYRYPTIKRILPDLNTEQIDNIISLLAGKFRHEAMAVLRKILPDENIAGLASSLMAVWNEMVSIARGGDFTPFGSTDCEHCGNCIGICGAKRAMVAEGLWDAGRDEPRKCPSFIKPETVEEIVNGTFSLQEVRPRPTRAEAQQPIRQFVLSREGMAFLLVEKTKHPGSSRFTIGKNIRLISDPARMVKWMGRMCMRDFNLQMDTTANVKLLVNGFVPEKGEKWSAYVSRAHEQTRQKRVERERSCHSLTVEQATEQLRSLFEAKGLSKVLNENFKGDVNMMISDFFPGKNVWDLMVEFGG